MKYGYKWRDYAFTQTELRQIIRTANQFSVWQNGRSRLDTLHNAAKAEGVKVRCEQQLIVGTLKGYAMGEPHFILVSVIR